MAININLGISAQAVQVRAQRATLIANNMANADTPDYKAVDLDFRQVLANIADEKGISLPETPDGMAATHPYHFTDNGFGDNQYLIDSTQPQYRMPALFAIQSLIS